MSEGVDGAADICTTPRLRLRTVVPSDAHFYHALLNDPLFVEHIGDRGVRTLDDARQALEGGPIAMQRAHGHSLYVVERRDDSAPVGMCGLIRRESLPDVDIGYAFLPAGRGLGYGLEAGRAVLAHAPAVGITRVLAITSPVNYASNILLQRLGMRFERFVRLPPNGAGNNLYSIELDATAARCPKGRTR